MNHTYSIFFFLFAALNLVVGAPLQTVTTTERDLTHGYDSNSATTTDLDTLLSVEGYYPSAQSESGLPSSVAVHRRSPKKKSSSAPSNPPSKLDKAEKGLAISGQVLNYAAKAADAIPVVGDIVGTAMQVVSEVLKVLAHIFKLVSEKKREAAQQRGAFTKDIVANVTQKYPGWFIVIVHSSHDAYFEGVAGTDWHSDKTELKTATGTCHFDVYSARAGIFINTGDGGYQNWAYEGNANVMTRSGQRITYNGPSPSYNPKVGGNCALHVVHYQAKSKSNPDPHDTLVVIVKDTSKTIIGFNKDGDASKPVVVESKLPKPVTVTLGQKNVITFQYGSTSFNSQSPVCSAGKFKNGVREMDCSFKC